MSQSSTIAMTSSTSSVRKGRGRKKDLVARVDLPAVGFDVAKERVKPIVERILNVQRFGLNIDLLYLAANAYVQGCTDMYDIMQNKKESVNDKVLEQKVNKTGDGVVSSCGYCLRTCSESELSRKAYLRYGPRRWEKYDFGIRLCDKCRQNLKGLFSYYPPNARKPTA